MPLASRIRVRPTRSRAWSSARTARSRSGRARHLQGHDGRPARRAGDVHCAVEGREPPGDTGQPAARRGRRRRGRRRRPRAAARRRRGVPTTQARPAPACLTMLVEALGDREVGRRLDRRGQRRRAGRRRRVTGSGIGSASASIAAGQAAVGQHRRVDAADHRAQVLQRRRPSSRGPRAAARPRPPGRCRSASRRGRRSCRPRRSGPGRRRAGRARSGAPRPRVVERLGARRGDLARPGARAARPGSGPRMLRSASARPRTSAGRDAPPGDQQRAVEQDQQPPPAAAVDQRARSGGRPAPSAAPTGSTDITNPPVAENHRNPKSRQRAWSRSQRTGRVTRLRVRRCRRTPARISLAEQRDR